MPNGSLCILRTVHPTCHHAIRWASHLAHDSLVDNGLGCSQTGPSGGGSDYVQIAAKLKSGACSDLVAFASWPVEMSPVKTDRIRAGA